MDRIDEDMTAYLEQVVQEESRREHDGGMATTLEAIGKDSHELVGICAVGDDSAACKAGDADDRFPVESVAKALTLALALEDRGPGKVFEHVDVEPEGEPYHSISTLFYYMRSHGVVEGSEEDLLMPYIKQGALEMDCADLAHCAAVLANDGCDPGSGTRLVSAETVRIVLTLMFTTGMYQGSGKFSVDVGIPAKSGVSGAIMAVAPGRMGFGLIGPSLDANGNSIAGVRMLRQVVERRKLRVFG